MQRVKAAGLDAAGGRGKNVLCFRDRKSIIFLVSKNISDICIEALNRGIKIIAVDSPLVILPRFRKVERRLISKGIRMLPPYFDGMIRLHKEVMRIPEFFYLIETYPRAVEKVLHSKLSFNDKDIKDAFLCLIAAECFIREDKPKPFIRGDIYVPNPDAAKNIYRDLIGLPRKIVYL